MDGVRRCRAGVLTCTFDKLIICEGRPAISGGATFNVPDKVSCCLDELVAVA